MDDDKFDDLLKSKFEDYEYSSAGTPNVAGFYNSLAFYRTSPWYSKYRTELFVTTAFIFFTLLNSFILWSALVAKEENRASTENNFKLQILDSITHVANQLKSEQQKQLAILNSNLTEQGSVNNRKQDVTSVTRNIIKTNRQEASDSNLLYLCEESLLQKKIYDKLADAGVLEIKNGIAYLNVSDKISQIRNTTYALAPPGNSMLFQVDSTSSSNIGINKPTGIEKVSNALSSKFINHIEETKYKSGIGINVYPHLDMANICFSPGSGNIAPRFGITTDWIVSPHWSIETSLDYLTIKATLHAGFQKYNLPKLDPELNLDGLKSAEILAQTTSLPIAIKYRWWLTTKNQLIFKMGYTPYFSFHNEYRYTSPYPGQAADKDITINTIEESNKIRFFGGTVTATAGIRKMVNKKNQIELALFYEKSMRGMGQEKLGMQIIGLRSAFLFSFK